MPILWQDPPSIVCPRCGMRSYHPRDISEQYCGNCRAYHDELENLPLERGDVVPPNVLVWVVLALLLAGIGLVTWWSHGHVL